MGFLRGHEHFVLLVSFVSKEVALARPRIRPLNENRINEPIGISTPHSALSNGT